MRVSHRRPGDPIVRLVQRSVLKEAVAFGLRFSKVDPLAFTYSI